MRIAELDRINELARQAKTVGLNEAEQAERWVLRQSYLRQVCGQVNNMLATVTVIDAEVMMLRLLNCVQHKQQVCRFKIE